MEDTIIYLYWMNILTFILYVLDKRQAVFHRWRIPEWVLFAFALMGGAFGALWAMWLFRHKTRCMNFRIAIPLFLLIQVVIVLVAMWNVNYFPPFFRPFLS